MHNKNTIFVSSVSRARVVEVTSVRGGVMQAPSSSRRQSRRGNDWAYGTYGDQVVWVCPPGGNIRTDKCGNKPQLQDYFLEQGKSPPEGLFTFGDLNAGNVPQSWRRVAVQADGEEEEENGSSGAGIAAGKVRRIAGSRSDPIVAKLGSM